MASVTGLTAEKMLELADENVVGAAIVGTHLVLTTRGGGDIDAGVVVGPTGATGATGPAGTTAPTIDTLANRLTANGSRGLFYASDKGALYADTGVWKLVAVLVDGDLRMPDTNNMDVSFTYTGANPTTITYKDQSGGGGVRRVEDTLGYNTDGTIATNTRRFYDTNGTTVLATVTEVYSYTSGAITGVGRTVT